jgi:endonuclease/exonuclease/phosphatase (EEP) superfamily protein YafD
MRFVSIIVVVLWLAYLCSLLGARAWILDLFTNFKLQYAVGFALSAAVLLIAQRWRFASLALVGFALNALPLFAQLISPAQAVATGETLRFASFNGWFRNTAPEDLDRIGRYLEAVRADIVVVQEFTPAVMQSLATRTPYYPYHYFAAAGQPSGTGVLSHWPLTETQALRIGPARIPVPKVSLRWHGQLITIFGVHLHWPLRQRTAQLRNRELEELALLMQREARPRLVGGDFNLTPWSSHFRDFVQRAELEDSAQGRWVLATWPRQFWPLGIRIDHCLTSSHWQTVALTVGPNLGSDHYPIVADLQLRQP